MALAPPDGFFLPEAGATSRRSSGGSGTPKGKRRGFLSVTAHVRGQPIFIHGVDIERRIGEDKIEFADGFVRVIVVAVDVSAVADVTFEAVNGEAHPRQTSGVAGLFHAAYQ